MDAVSKMDVACPAVASVRAAPVANRRSGISSRWQPGFCIEPLEPRVLLSTTPLAVTQIDSDASGFHCAFQSVRRRDRP